MNEDKLPFSRPYLGDEEIDEAVAVLRSGWLTSGPRVQRFERDFADYVGSPHGAAVSSCTAALHLALLAHGIGPAPR
jgi:perosamine synthetase